MHDVPSSKFVKQKFEALCPFVRNATKQYNLSLSAGAVVGSTFKHYDEMFVLADKALYEAKNLGGQTLIIQSSNE